MAKINVHIEAENTADFYQTLERLYLGAPRDEEPDDAENEQEPEPQPAPKARGGRKAKAEQAPAEQAPVEDATFKSAPAADSADEGETIGTGGVQPRQATTVADVENLPADSKAFNGFISDIMGRLMEVKSLSRPDAAKLMMTTLAENADGAKSADQLYLKKDPALVAAAYEALKALVA